MNNLKTIKAAILSFQADLNFAEAVLNKLNADTAFTCNCSAPCYEPDYCYQLSPGHVCNHHQSIEDAEMELACASAMLNTLGEDLVFEETALAIFNSNVDC